MIAKFAYKLAETKNQKQINYAKIEKKSKRA